MNTLFKKPFLCAVLFLSIATTSVSYVSAMNNEKKKEQSTQRNINPDNNQLTIIKLNDKISTPPSYIKDTTENMFNIVKESFDNTVTEKNEKTQTTSPTSDSIITSTIKSDNNSTPKETIGKEEPINKNMVIENNLIISVNQYNTNCVNEKIEIEKNEKNQTQNTNPTTTTNSSSTQKPTPCYNPDNDENTIQCNNCNDFYNLTDACSVFIRLYYDDNFGFEKNKTNTYYLGFLMNTFEFFLSNFKNIYPNYLGQLQFNYNLICNRYNKQAMTTNSNSMTYNIVNDLSTACSAFISLYNDTFLNNKNNNCYWNFLLDFFNFFLSQPKNMHFPTLVQLNKAYDQFFANDSQQLINYCNSILEAISKAHVLISSEKNNQLKCGFNNCTITIYNTNKENHTIKKFNFLKKLKTNGGVNTKPDFSSVMIRLIRDKKLDERHHCALIIFSCYDKFSKKFTAADLSINENMMDKISKLLKEAKIQITLNQKKVFHIIYGFINSTPGWFFLISDAPTVTNGPEIVTHVFFHAVKRTKSKSTFLTKQKNTHNNK